MYFISPEFINYVCECLALVYIYTIDFVEVHAQHRFCFRFATPYVIWPPVPIMVWCAIRRGVARGLVLTGPSPALSISSFQDLHATSSFQR